MKTVVALALCVGVTLAVAKKHPAAEPSPSAVAIAELASIESGYEVLDDVDLGHPLAGVSIKAGRNGHFYLKAYVNGKRLPFVVDTGASYVMLSYRDARKAGVRLSRKDFKHEVSTANGKSRVAAVRLKSIRYKSIRVNDVIALIGKKGALSGANLLGNSFLSKLRQFQIKRGKLTLR